THQELDLASMKTRQSQMEEDMQGAYAIYTKLQSQCVAAESKVLERTPVFTTVQAASVPVKPAGPKRLFFIITMLMVCFAITSVVLLVKDKSLKW
ncbi:MAG: chain-length determining protein, partial [Alloprevotella sp.]|nr:chain-length determining protein [Alloprevotella sp.]